MVGSFRICLLDQIRQEAKFVLAKCEVGQLITKQKHRYKRHTTPKICH